MAKGIDLNQLVGQLQFSTTITAAEVIVTLLITFLIGLFIFYIYKHTFSGVLYSRDFNVTLIITSMVVAVIMMGISRNLALSLGLIGALSIVRFRNAVKDTKDVAFLFWSISVGIVNGVQFFMLSVISSICIGLVLYIFSRNITLNEPYVVVLKYKNIDEKQLESIIKKHCSKYKFRSTNVSKEFQDKTIEIKLKRNKETSFVTELRAIEGMQNVMMFSHSGKLSD